MGSKFTITIVSSDSSQALQNIQLVENEVSRIEDLISDWRPNTYISQINKNAGITAIKVPLEVYNLTKRAIYFSEITQGAFDISYAAMDKVWKFDGSMQQIPDSQTIKKSIVNVGYKHIILNDNDTTIFLEKKGMKISFGSIGKGYAADMGRRLMLGLGVIGGIVDASGDISTWGRQPNGKSWVVGVTNPFKPNKIKKIITLKDSSIVTSGSYEKFALIDGKRYSHIINPATGYPATGIVSVTIAGPSAEFANGLSTSIMVLGIEKSKKLLQQFPNYHSYIISDKGKVHN
ncbi:FAD:protein FMN transferase [Rhizosphaericola mali]|uniref:FAD:protein FMN transferase n=2 Tax=Rhizosphaericola mali TaxID=2545455 RepID=A0A5P2G5T0_9BACT|nr:FAD:protein FMN transferase [Rhizosphaericola mali]